MAEPAVARQPVSLDDLCINTVRTLAMDAVQAAKCGHPGAPMGLAPLGYLVCEATGGGLLSEPGSADSLGAQLESLMLDPGARHELGRRGAESVQARFSDVSMAETTLAVYLQWVDEPQDEAA